MTKSPSEDSRPFRARLDNPARPAATSLLGLEAQEVHVWLARLNDYSGDDLKHLLSEDELTRAARFHFDKDRNHYIVARAWLRKLLAAYLGLSAAKLEFSYGKYGKPCLDVGQGSSLSFNLAHSHELGIFAFSRSRELGVDLEFIREDLADEKIAERFFSQSEIDVLKNLPAEQKKQAFFACWTRKEAYIKARGEGLSMPLNEFDVSLAPGEAAALLRNHREPEETSRWSMRSVEVPDGYVAALVASGQDWRLLHFAVDQLP